MDFKLVDFFQIQVDHDYFKEGICPYFDLIPSIDSTRKLKNFNIFRKLLTNKFSFHIGLRDFENEISEAARGLSHLTFFLTNKHEYLVNYTNLRLLDRDLEILYLSTSESESPLTLGHAANSQDIVALRPLRFSFETEDAKKVQVKTEDGKIIVAHEPQNSGKQLTDINLKQFGEARYEIWVDDEKAVTFFAFGQELPRNCIGVINISMNDVLDMLSEGKKAAFYIGFEAKSCVWEYEIALAGQSKIEIDELAITKGQDLSFVQSRVEELPNGVEKKIFTATEERKLVAEMEDHPELVVKYHNLHSDRKLELTKMLPVPDVKRIQQKVTADGKIEHFAPTLVYI